jgi:hypothetical protein
VLLAKICVQQAHFVKENMISIMALAFKTVIFGSRNSEIS